VSADAAGRLVDVLARLDDRRANLVLAGASLEMKAIEI